MEIGFKERVSDFEIPGYSEYFSQSIQLVRFYLTNIRLETSNRGN
jgi:hypothetical protein